MIDAMDRGGGRRVAVLLGGSLAALGACGREGFELVRSASRAREATLDAFATGSTSFVPAPISLTFGSADDEEGWLVLLSASLRGELDIGFRPTTQVRYLIDGVERGLGEAASGSFGTNAW